MFDGLRRYVWDRRRGIAKFVGVAGTVYFVTKYVLERLEEMREKAKQDRAARENLKRRFLQNQQDCTFTVLALLPTLGSRILEEMDVEVITEALQGRSTRGGTTHTTAVGVAQGSRDPSISSVRSGRISPPPSAAAAAAANAELGIQNQLPASLVQSAIRGDRDRHSSGVSVNGDDAGHHGHLGESSLSWVEQFTTASSASGGHGSPTSSAGPLLSDMNLSGSASVASDTEAKSEGSFRSLRYGDKSKAELWKEVKILTLTRTLTTIYSLSLLMALTHIQLNLIGRTKYVYSVLQMELRERVEAEFSISSLFWGGLTDSLFGPTQDEKDAFLKKAELADETERKYLLLSWWLSHVSWQQLAETVRVCVEERVASVSLKSMLNANDIMTILNEVRQTLSERISSENPPSFCDMLLPPDADLIDHVLTSSGVPKDDLPSSSPDELFTLLVDDTRRFIHTPDFDLAFNAMLDKSFSVLEEYLNSYLFDVVVGPDGKTSHRFADVLPVMARWSHVAIYGLPNEVVEALASVEELTGFSAVIYSSYNEQYS